MCIRDRRIGGRRRWRRRARRWDRRIGGRRGWRGRCLLYKSDAADDPRCVDLGGRRIIKKKKDTKKGVKNFKPTQNKH